MTIIEINMPDETILNATIDILLHHCPSLQSVSHIKQDYKYEFTLHRYGNGPKSKKTKRATDIEKKYWEIIQELRRIS